MGDELLDEVRPEKHLRALRRHRDLDHLRGRRRHAQLAQHRQEDVVVLLILLEGQVLAGEHAGGQPDAEAPLVVRPAGGPELDHGHQHVREVLPVGLAVLDAEHHPAQLQPGGLGGGGNRREPEQRQREPQQRASHGRPSGGVRVFSLIGWSVAPRGGSVVLVS